MATLRDSGSNEHKGGIGSGTGNVRLRDTVATVDCNYCSDCAS